MSGFEEVPPMFPRVFLSLFATVVLLGCAGDPQPNGSGGSDDYARMVGEAEPARMPSALSTGVPGPAVGAPTGRTVTLPRESVRQLDEFLATPRTVLGNRVEISMSRRPFLGQFMVTSPIRGGSVARDEVKDPDLGLLTITLENRSGTRTVLGDMPRVRLGEGLEVVAVDQLVIRVWDRTEESLPVFLEVTGLGDSLYVEEGPPVIRQRGAHAEVSARISREGAGYRFDEAWSVR